MYTRIQKGAAGISKEHGCVFSWAHAPSGESQWCPGELFPCSPIPTLPNPTPGTGTFLGKHVRSPLEAPSEGRSSTELQWGLTAALGPGTHWICPQGVTAPAWGKYPTGYEFYNKWVYFKWARQALSSFSAQPPVFPPHSSASEEGSCLHTRADHSVPPVPHLSQSYPS